MDLPECVTIIFAVFVLVQGDPDLIKTKEIKEKHNVTVEIYYEVLCPDSRDFILHQLYPTWQKIGSVMNIKFKPFGKASYFPSSRGFKFHCQHGPAECLGNMVHSCAIEHIENPNITMEYIRCMIYDNFDPKESGSKCAEAWDVDWTTIEKCVEGHEGAELLAAHGENSRQLHPKISFVPTVVVDGKLTRQGDVLQNLLRSVCRVYQDTSLKNCIEII